MLRKSLGLVGLIALSLVAGCITTGPSVFLTGLIVPLPREEPVTLTATGNPGSSSGLWTYTFASSCGGTFAPSAIGPTNLATVTTIWTTPAGAVPSCTVTVTLTTAAGRKATASASTVISGQIVEPGESLQDAINNAEPGEVIVVREGTYTEDITINVDGLQLIAGSRPIIDGDLIVNADNVRIQGFEVTGVLETTTTLSSFYNLTLADTRIYGEVFNTTLSCNDVVNDGESIQTAIGAVGAASTVCVGPGTYTEQILIEKDLTLQAIAGTPIIKAPPSGTRTTYTIPESTATWDPIVFARGIGTAVVNVSISGFEVDGQSNYGSTSTRYVGVLYRNVAGAISNNVVKDLGHDGTQTFGILVYGDSNVTISNNDVSNYGRGGIGANGDLGSGSPPPLGPQPDPTVVIQGNTVTGPGATAPQTWASNGIQIGWGATGSILDNEVIGNGWPGTAWTGTGIIVVDASGVVIEGNNVHDNESAIIVGQFYNPASGIVVRGNTVVNNDWGIQVINNASNTIVEDNTVTNQNGDGIDVWNYGWSWTLDPTGTEVHNNSIVGSGYDGAWTNVTAEVVDMTDNWWGDASGPYDSGETTEVPPCTASPASEINADGLGDSVGDTSTEVIDYCPWLSSAPAGALRTLTAPPTPRSRSVRSETPTLVQPIE